MDAHLPKIDAAPRQLEQVLVNLYLNAIDAMPDGGKLTVRASVTSEPIDGKPNGVIISVTDTGSGIEPENIYKIFQPFFTANKKTGLGLDFQYASALSRTMAEG
jgi:signal transduction histidine kinase